jgi:hypothetical protein
MRSSSVKADDKFSGTLVVVDIETRRAVDIDIGKLIRSSQDVGLGPDGPTRQTIDPEQISVGGTYNSVIFAASNGRVVDVFKIQEGQPSFIGTYTASDFNGRLFFTSDGKTMVLISGDKAELWDISLPMTSRVEALVKASANELIKFICKSGLPQTADQDFWRIAEFDNSLVKPCVD